MPNLFEIKRMMEAVDRWKRLAGSAIERGLKPRTIEIYTQNYQRALAHLKRLCILYREV